MKSFGSRLSLMFVSLALWSAEALAQSHRRPAVNVPEIDATTGLLAVAAVLAVVTFVYDRCRRLS